MNDSRCKRVEVSELVTDGAVGFDISRAGFMFGVGGAWVVHANQL